MILKARQINQKTTQRVMYSTQLEITRIYLQDVLRAMHSISTTTLEGAEGGFEF